MRFINVLLVVFLCGVQATLWLGRGGIRDVARYDRELATQTARVEALRARNVALMAEVIDLKEGLEAIEELARSEMGMVKKDEVFYQIVAPTKMRAGVATDHE